MKQQLALTALVVKDYDEAIDFYVDILGFSKKHDTLLSHPADPADPASPDADKRWVVVAPPGSEESGLLLAKADGEQQAAPQDFDRLPTEAYEDINVAERAISAQNAFLITQALNSAIWGADWSVSPGWQGTGFRGRTLKRRDIAGKTGTTNEAKDAWFSGYSRRMVATSWIGFDDHTRNLGQTTYNGNLGKNQITGKEFGAKSAQPAWISFMKAALEELPVEPFEPPEDIVSVRIDKASGKLTSKTDKTSIFEYFQLGTAPTESVISDESSVILDGEAEEEIF